MLHISRIALYKNLGFFYMLYIYKIQSRAPFILDSSWLWIEPMLLNGVTGYLVVLTKCLSVEFLFHFDNLLLKSSSAPIIVARGAMTCQRVPISRQIDSCNILGVLSGGSRPGIQGKVGARDNLLQDRPYLIIFKKKIINIRSYVFLFFLNWELNF